LVTELLKSSNHALSHARLSLQYLSLAPSLQLAILTSRSDSNMEAVASAANVSQLVVSSFSSDHHPQPLYTEPESCDPVYLEEEVDSSLLLDVTQNLSS
jgi:hypothetical protein